MYTSSAIDLRGWIDDHRHLLKPPVGNSVMFDHAEFIIMIVGGPNARKDYHYDEGEELFYQVEGDIVVKVIDDGVPKDIAIREGELFLLPARVPHSPQRGPDTVGLVVERRRQPDELDGFFWFCERCGHELHREFLPVADIVAQLPPVMERFYASERLRTCTACGAIMEPPRATT